MNFVAGDSAQFEYDHRPPSARAKKTSRRRNKKKKQQSEDDDDDDEASDHDLEIPPEAIAAATAILNNLQLPEAISSVVAAALVRLHGQAVKVAAGNDGGGDSDGSAPSIGHLANEIIVKCNKLLAKRAGGGPQSKSEKVDSHELALRQQELHKLIFVQMPMQFIQQLQQQKTQTDEPSQLSQLSQEPQDPQQLQLRHQIPLQQQQKPLHQLQQQPQQQQPSPLPQMPPPIQSHSQSSQHSHSHSHSHQHSPPPHSHSSHQHHMHSHSRQRPRSRAHDTFKGNRDANEEDKIWDTGTAEERQRVKQFWLGLTEDERRNLVKIEKHTVMQKMREQKRTNCNCSVCGRKRLALEQLKSLYDTYNEMERNRRSHNEDGGGIDDSDEDDGKTDGNGDSEDRKQVSEDFDFGSSLTIKGGILTVADDLLKNDGKKFIDMIENLAERRMRREEEMEALADYVLDGNEQEEDDDTSYIGDSREDYSDYDFSRGGFREESDYDDEEDDEDDEYDEDEYDDDVSLCLSILPVYQAN